MTQDPTQLIVGASLAGAKAAEALRAAGFEGPVTLIGAEDELPYERPPLSKGYLQGKAGRETIYAHPADWYASASVDLRLGVRVTGLDPVAHEVTLADGGTLSYGTLLLTTGSSPRGLQVPGGDLDGVLYLRTLADCDRLKGVLGSVRRIAVIGAGWIGLEVAAAARTVGIEVTVIEVADLPLLRVLGREVAEIFARLHRDHDVGLRLGAQVAEIRGVGGRVAGVRLADDSVIPAEAVVVAVGIRPNTELAEAAGLTVADGVVVDAQLRTSHPDIFAAGDVASAYHPLLDRHIRVEHWANALNQPQTAARAMIGQDRYDRVPYFFTDQYDLGMEYAGYVEPGGYDHVVFRGDVGQREFIAFWVDAASRVLAGMNVNVWDVNDAIQSLVRRRQPVADEALRDPSVPLDSLATA